MKKRWTLINSDLLLDKWRELLQVAVPNAGQLVLSANGLKIYAAISVEGYKTLLVLSPEQPPKITEFDAVLVKWLRQDNEMWATSFILQSENFDSEFATLCADMCEEVSLSTDAETALANQYSAYESWLDFYRRSNKFNLEKARGLFGELKFLSEHLLITHSASAILDSWHGPLGGYHDFVLENARAVEVKTVNPSTTDVLISSEHQLAFSGDLTLAVYRLLTLDADSKGETLNELIAQVRKSFSDPENRRFSNLLSSTGYKEDLRVSSERRFEVQEVRFFDANTSGFPRLTENTLPIGIRKVSYRLSLAHLNEFEIQGVKF
jgi:hypothetical protein